MTTEELEWLKKEYPHNQYYFDNPEGKTLPVYPHHMNLNMKDLDLQWSSSVYNNTYPFESEDDTWSASEISLDNRKLSIDNILDNL